MAGRTAKSAASAKTKARKGNKTAKKATRTSASVKDEARKRTKTASKATTKSKIKARAAGKKKTPTKKTAVKKATAKKTAPNTSAAKKTAPKKAASKKSGVRKPKSATKNTPKSAFDKVEAAQRRVKRQSKSKLSAFDQKVLAELDELARVIQDAKREIAEIRPDEVKTEHLPQAADELDAVVAATADATNTIMDACEIVEGVMANLSGADANKLMDATTRIYEACTFQDITGQRITKVVGTMKHIEARIDRLVAAFGGDPSQGAGKGADKASKPAKAPDDADTVQHGVRDEDLLEGPQLGDKAKSQAEIDDLLASFD